MLAKQITSLRKQAGMSQLQLAKELHVSPSAVGMYEQGRRTPALDMLVKMTKLFNVSLDYLVTGREMPGSIAEGNKWYKNDCLCRGGCLCIARKCNGITATIYPEVMI